MRRFVTPQFFAAFYASDSPGHCLIQPQLLTRNKNLQQKGLLFFSPLAISKKTPTYPWNIPHESPVKMTEILKHICIPRGNRTGMMFQGSAGINVAFAYSRYDNVIAVELMNEPPLGGLPNCCVCMGIWRSILSFQVPLFSMCVGMGCRMGCKSHFFFLINFTFGI